MLNQFLFGCIFLGFLAASLFFLKFWRKTRDSLFLMFSLAFALLAVERVLLAFVFQGNEFKVYLIRLAAFVVILVAIIQKNRKAE